MSRILQIGVRPNTENTTTILHLCEPGAGQHRLFNFAIKLSSFVKQPNCPWRRLGLRFWILQVSIVWILEIARCGVFTMSRTVDLSSPLNPRLCSHCPQPRLH
jgi:hypothetical protein